MLARARQYLAYRRVFSTHADVQRFRRVRHHPEAGTPAVALHVRGVSTPLWVRPATVDATTLWDAFALHFHLPAADGPFRTIVDLGANAGYTAADLATRYPAARIVAVELDGGNAALARQNLESFAPRVTVIHAGVWSSTGTITYGGVKVDDYAIGHGAQSAPAISPADLVRQYDLGVVDYLKMDIEGAEYDVLPLCLGAMTIRHLQIEVHPPATLEYCRELLEAHGFSVWKHPVHPRSFYASDRLVSHGSPSPR